LTRAGNNCEAAGGIRRKKRSQVAGLHRCRIHNRQVTCLFDDINNEFTGFLRSTSLQTLFCMPYQRIIPALAPTWLRQSNKMVS
jgi:hypothetical protein